MLLTQFIRDEDGAVTTDYVVLTAAVCGCMMAFSDHIMSSLSAFSNTAANEMNADNVSTYDPAFGVDAINGGFEDTYGLMETGEGYAGLTANGWTASAGGWIDIHDSSKSVVKAKDGGNFIDLATSNGNAAVVQDLSNLDGTESYTVTISAMDKVGDNSMEVYFGGEKVGTVAGGSDWNNYSFEITSRAGNGSNQLELREVGGGDDATGTYVDNVKVEAITPSSNAYASKG